MGSSANLAMGDSYISMRSARASSMRSLAVPAQEPFRRSASFNHTIRGRTWNLKRQKSLSAFVYNIVVLGSGEVGKTSIVQHYVQGSFPERHTPTLADVYEKNIRRVSKEDDTQYCLKIYDTSGTLSFPAMNRLTIKNGNGFILIYSMDDKNSFEQVKRIHEEILEVKRVNNSPLLLVSNKSDLSSSERVITTQQGMKLARDWGVNFAEISARNKKSIEEIFQIILEEFDTVLADASALQTRSSNIKNGELLKRRIKHKKKNCTVM